MNSRAEFFFQTRHRPRDSNANYNNFTQSIVSVSVNSKPRNRAFTVLPTNRDVLQTVVSTRTAKAAISCRAFFGTQQLHINLDVCYSLLLFEVDLREPPIKSTFRLYELIRYPADVYLPDVASVTAIKMDEIFYREPHTYVRACILLKLYVFALLDS